MCVKRISWITAQIILMQTHCFEITEMDKYYLWSKIWLFAIKGGMCYKIYGLSDKLSGIIAISQTNSIDSSLMVTDIDSSNMKYTPANKQIYIKI